MLLGDRLGVIFFGLGLLWLVAVAIERIFARFSHRWTIGIMVMIVGAVPFAVTAATVGGVYSDEWFIGAFAPLGTLIIAVTFWGSSRAGLGVVSDYPDRRAGRVLSSSLLMGGFLLSSLSLD